MNFGVDVLQLKQIAQNYPTDKVLADMLWREDVREMKILATMLYPSTDFSEETADRWVKEIPNQEIREQVCRNLFQKLDYADKVVQRWVENSNEDIRATGYWLYARLCIIRSGLMSKIGHDALLQHAVNDLDSESMLVRQAALNVLKYDGRVSKEHATGILQRIAAYENSDDVRKKEFFDLLRFEFDDVD